MDKSIKNLQHEGNCRMARTLSAIKATKENAIKSLTNYIKNYVGPSTNNNNG